MSPKYWSIYGLNWAKYIYKYQSRDHTKKCQFECYYDDECDFYVDYYYCHYGKFSYTGNQIITWNYYVYYKIKFGNSAPPVRFEWKIVNILIPSLIGRTPPTSIITSNFDSYTGDNLGNYPFLTEWFMKGIWGHYSTYYYSTEAHCAIKCLSSTVYGCSFYYYGNSYCQIGNYNYGYGNHYGSISKNAVYKHRKDYGTYL